MAFLPMASKTPRPVGVGLGSVVKLDQELKLPKFCLWHVAWSLNIPPAKIHAPGKSCQKQILSSMASGIFRKQAKLQAAGKNFLQTNPINFFACCMGTF